MANDAGPIGFPERFELTRFLHGRTKAWGIFEDRFGRIRRRFSVEMTGSWRGQVFHLDEVFHYDDGRVENRAWVVTPGQDGAFSATCADCIGVATGQCTAQSIEMRYRFRLQLPSRVLAVTFHDRIYRMEDGRAVNRATMSKWGVKLGELSLFFEPAEEASLPVMPVKAAYAKR